MFLIIYSPKTWESRNVKRWKNNWKENYAAILILKK